MCGCVKMCVCGVYVLCEGLGCTCESACMDMCGCVLCEVVYWVMWCVLNCADNLDLELRLECYETLMDRRPLLFFNWWHGR